MRWLGFVYYELYTIISYLYTDSHTHEYYYVIITFCVCYIKLISAIYTCEIHHNDR